MNTEYKCGDPRNGAPEMQRNTPSVGSEIDPLPMTPLYRCPKCKSVDLRVEVVAVAAVLQDDDGNVQTDIASDHDWSDDSLMLCNACEHDGPSKTFATPWRQQ